MPAGRPRLPNARRVKRYYRVSEGESVLIDEAAEVEQMTAGQFAREAILARVTALLLRMRGKRRQHGKT